ncbi:MAG: hypothetical protein AVDCRST_MAG54-2380, partial [uncultured Actinomycetospora sp.]
DRVPRPSRPAGRVERRLRRLAAARRRRARPVLRAGVRHPRRRAGRAAAPRGPTARGPDPAVAPRARGAAARDRRRPFPLRTARCGV